MSATVLSNRRPLPLDTPVVYYNLWKGFRTTRFRDQFTTLSGADVSKLTPGAVIYKDVDPLHPSGKVYGYLKGQVTSVTILGDDVRVDYTFGGASGGMTRVSLKAAETEFWVANDEEKLADILAELPQATVI